MIRIKHLHEGVETEAQLETLRTMGCPLAQGFLLGRPSPPDALRCIDMASSDRMDRST